MIETHQEYDGKINFTTDGWTSPNHRAFVAFCAHFEHNGESLSIPLDIIEVAKVKLTEIVENHCKLMLSQSHTGEELAETFAKMLEEFRISDKVSE
jgi:hypothetical protein